MKAKKKNPTVVDVAKLAGVGVMTVSRAINQQESVKLRTREKVFKAIRELGYKQNEAARMMKGQRAKLIGLIVPDLSDMFFAAFAHRAQQLAREHGYMTLVAASELNPELERAQAELIAARNPEGMLIATSTEETDYLTSLQKAGLKIVAFDRPLSGVMADAVVVENRLGAMMATQHLIEHGHKRILCLGSGTTPYTVSERLAGYQAALTKAGYAPIMLPEPSSQIAFLEWLKKQMKQKSRPTAVFSVTHRTTTMLLEAAINLQISIPDELALIGFDDFTLATVLRPTITTVAQSPGEIAKRAIDLLIGRIREGKGVAQECVKLSIPVALKIRRSCGCDE